jgi:hypothetical protein
MMQGLRHSFLEGALDWERFGALLFAKFEARDLSFRACSMALGLPDHNTLYRACRGDPVSADTYLYLCREFDIDPFAVFTMPLVPEVADARP